MNPQPTANKPKSRELHEPRLRPGLRIRYDSGKWDTCANAVRFMPDWASQSWANTRLGVTVDPSEHPGHIYPENHPWGVPDFATPLRFDDSPDEVTWVRTSCLDVVGDVIESRKGQQELLFPTG